MAATVNYYPPVGASQSLFNTRALALVNSLATFNGFRYVPVGIYSYGVDSAARVNNQTSISGGGAASDGTPAILTFTNNFIQSPKTLPWFVSFRAKVTGAFAGVQFAFVGTSDGTNDAVRCGYAGGYSNSFWSMDVGHGGVTTSGVSTIALDTNMHDHSIYFDGSTACTYYIDGALAITISTLTNFPTTAQSLASLASTNVFVISECFYAFNEST